MNEKAILKHKQLNAPEVFFKDCFRKNKIVKCQDRIFLQNNIDITDDIYNHVFPVKNFSFNDHVDVEMDSFFGIGLIIQNTPEQIVSKIRKRLSRGIKTIPHESFILGNSDISISKTIRFAQFDVAFENIDIKYVFEGELKISIGPETFKLKKGSAIVLSPNIGFSEIIDDEDTIVFDLMIRVSTFTSAFLNLITGNNYISKFFINMLYSNNPPPYTIIQSPPDDKLADTLLQLFELQEDTHPNIMMNNVLAQLFICHLFYHYEDYIQNKHAFNKNEILVADIVSYLHNNYSNTSLQDVSEQFSLSAKYMSKILNERLGLSYMSIITDIKIDKAKEFLKSTDLSIEEICSLVGYSDSRQLRSLFNQKYGMSPSEYRKTIKKQS